MAHLQTRIALVFALLASLYAQDAKAADSNLPSFCSTSFALLGGAKPADLAKRAVFDTVPPEAEPLASAPREATSSVVYQVPFSDAEYKAIFSRQKVSVTEQQEMQSARSLFVTLKISTRSDVKSSDDFETYLNSTKSRNVIVVGHNKDGGFSFLNGTSSKIWDLSDSCAKAKKNCIFISCRAENYVRAGSLGAARDLTLEEGIYIANKIDSWLQEQTGQITDLMLTQFVGQVQTQAHLKYHVAYIAMKGCGAAAGGVTLYLLVQEVRQ